MIDFSQSRNDEPVEKLIHKCEFKAKSTSGKELPKLDVGIPVLYDNNPDSTKVKRPKWCKETIKNRQILKNMKFLLMIQTESLSDPEGM